MTIVGNDWHYRGMRTWYVYGLFDQRTNAPFYVGMTGNIASTMARHWNDKHSAAAARCSELRDTGHQLDLRILSSFDDRKAALEEEGRLITSLPDLVNRTHKPAKPKMKRFVLNLDGEDRDALERLRVARGARSEAEVLRALIRENTDDDEVTIGIVKTPKSTKTVDITPLMAAPRVIKGVVELGRAASVPYAGAFKRGPMQKTPKR